MTPPAATAPARTRVRRPARPSAPKAPRRVSGLARTPARTLARTPARTGLVGAGAAGAGTVAAPLGARLLRRAVALPDARLLDRLVRGRLWIALLGAGLVGIVFLQISLLELNTGISRAVGDSQLLERRNTALKTELSALAGGERIQDSAAVIGFVTPAAGQPRFLDARGASAERAAGNIVAPAPIAQLPLGMIPPAEGGTAGLAPAPAGPTTGAAPAAGTAESTPPAPVAPAVDATAATAPAASPVAPAPAPGPGPAPAPVPVPEPAPAAAPATTAPPPTSAAGGVAATPEG